MGVDCKIQILLIGNIFDVIFKLRLLGDGDRGGRDRHWRSHNYIVAACFLLPLSLSQQ